MITPVSTGSSAVLVKESLVFLTRSAPVWVGNCVDATGEGTLSCPSLCPETAVSKWTGYEDCQMDSLYKCVYGDAVICDDAKFSRPP